MDLNEYQNLAARTDVPQHQIAGLSPNVEGLLNGALGAVGEAAEISEHIKKVVFQGHPLDTDKLIEECGDVMWYLAKLARKCDVTLEEVGRRNIDKLMKRYPDGFSAEQSINRKEATSE